ncbi:MAG TPA: Arc family DNA-binding protein [Trueperaceae bacterium]|nr:Arc family DNA-binding protein [Trueperaceae bacterium]
MPTITIRNLPDDVVERIKLRAKNRGRSMEQELRELLISHYETRENILRRIEERWVELPKTTKEEIDSWQDVGRD